MADDRARRAVIMEAAFRIANDRMAAWEEGSPTDPELFFCECLNEGCRAKVPLTRDEYEAVRTDAQRFFVVPDHQDEELEDVIERHGEYIVIEKHNDVEDLASATDPRSKEPGGPAADEARRIAEHIRDDD
jgi:hypothetical protein